jgi:Spy/CpxP family protein refolding chaperone
MKRLSLLAGTAALVALITVPAASAAFAAPAPEEPAAPPVAGDREPSGRDAGARRHGPRARVRARLRAAHGRRAVRRFVRSLDLSEAQVATMKEAREASAKVRRDAHAEVRTVVRDARRAGDRSEAARTALREKVRAVRASARQAVEPQAKRVLESLTPEQRAKIEARAKERGRTVDEAKLLERIERLLLARGARRR